MKRLASLEQVTDFGDFTRGSDLTDFLKQSYINNCSKNVLHNVRVSPDGQHIHAILHKPNSVVLTFDKLQRTPLVPSHNKHIELNWTRTVPIVDLVYLESRQKEGGSVDLVLVLENGKVEFWKYWEGKGSWQLQVTSELCNSPRAKVVSVCTSSKCIIWCEERPPSESASVCTAARNTFRYCICTRSYELEERGVSLGGVKIILHNNPRYTVISSGGNVYLLPDKETQPASLSKFFLMCSPPTMDTITVCNACKGTFLKKESRQGKESDFKRLISDCIGVLSTSSPPEICSVFPTGCGGLLLLLSSGWISILGADGVLRQVYKLADNCLTDRSTHSSMQVYGELLAFAVERTLYLIDTRCGAELEKIPLNKEGLLFVNCRARHLPHMLTDAGIFVSRLRGLDRSPKPLCHTESIRPDSLLVEAVFEEACKYYQRRSLSSTQLTVEKLKSGGMFQAPIALSSILGGYLRGHKPTGDLVQGEDPISYAKLFTSLEPELKSLIALEEVKTAVVRASEKELSGYSEALVSEEVSRLLSTDLDRENLQYLNMVFNTFPLESWQALQAGLQLGPNGEGSLLAKTGTEVWKSILSPLPAAHPSLTNSQKGGTPANNNHSSSNGAVPVFELICRSLLTFQPQWLPRFVELAQQQQQQAGASSWSYGVKEGPESVPLYKRALSVLPERSESQDLEVELLLCSQRPNAVMQALRTLIEQRQWGRVTQVAESFCRQSPLLNKEIFTSLLCEVSQHRDLDPYLDLLWTLCPEDFTVTSILNIVLKNLPLSSPEPSPFQTEGSQLTIGTLKPLLSKVLQRETKPSQRYADILQSPFPPPTPPRQIKGLPSSVSEPAINQSKQRTPSPTKIPTTTNS